MKKCPTCEKTFDDALRFCQTDGTPLIEINESASEDPYKTTVGRQGDFASATPSDPFKTMVAGSLKNDDSDVLLQLPEENQDPLKTMFISDEEMKREISGNEPEKEKIIEVQPLNDVSVSSTEKTDLPYTSPTPPIFNEPSLSPPNFGDLSPGFQSESPSASESQPEKISNPFSEPSSKGIPSPFDQKPSGSEIKNPFESSPFSQPNAPIPSPFSDAKPTSYNTPSAPLPTYKEPEPTGYEQNNPFSQTPFGQSAMPGNESLQQKEWTPPPVPDSNWQNQEIGANTPFQPPASGAGQNQTLAIVSLVLGIIGILLCQLTAPAAIVTGFMARKKATENPAEYGGGALALAGIITGAIGTLLLVLVVIYFIFIFGLVASQTF
jgi:hypothetical protein